jgi:hypothetical protein
MDLDKTEDADEEKKIDLKNQIKELNDRIDAATALSLEKTVKYTELK